MNATIRCKLWVSEVVHVQNEKGQTESERIKLIAVYSDCEENKHWSKYTPSANFEFTINNLGAFGKFSRGQEFYVDFTPVET